MEIYEGKRPQPLWPMTTANVCSTPSEETTERKRAGVKEVGKAAEKGSAKTPKIYCTSYLFDSYSSTMITDHRLSRSFLLFF